MSLPELTGEEKQRYARHLLLEDVGQKGQRILKKSRVLCVGTGGLGSPLLLYLAAAGVGRIGVVDFDVVDASNLQRQIAYGTEHVGRPKARVAKERIESLNPNVTVDVYDERLTADNALRILEPYDVVVDGTDNFPARYLINDACVLLGKPNVYGSIFKFEGQASVFNHNGGPDYRDLYPQPPPPGMIPSCAEAGVLGILPGVIGCIQATETLKILLGKGTTLSGRLLTYDAMSMQFYEVRLHKNPDRKPVTELLDYDAFCGQGEEMTNASLPTGQFTGIDVFEASERMEDGWDPFVLDVRAAHEAEIVQFDFADRLQPHTEVGAIVAELPTDRDILVHCKLGGRSAKACQVLAEAGLTRIFNLEGGIVGWARDVDPSMMTY